MLENPNQAHTYWHTLEKLTNNEQELDVGLSCYKYSKKSHVSCVTQCHSGSTNTNHFSYNNNHKAMESVETRR